MHLRTTYRGVCAVIASNAWRRIAIDLFLNVKQDIDNGLLGVVNNNHDSQFT